MSNQIRLKRASGSDPGASDLVLGEPAVRTDTGEIFLKKDDGSIAKVAGGIDDGDKGDITVSNDGGTFTIDRELITFVKILIDDKHTDAVLLDIYNHPIAVDLQNFYSEIMSRYFEVTNDYYVEYEKIRKARKVSSVLDLNNPGSESGE